MATSSSNGHTIGYTYDHSGLRFTKTVDGQVTRYRYKGSRLISEQRPDGRRLFYHYEGDNLFGFDVVNVTAGTSASYFYRQDGMGNIAGICDGSGNLIASYTYGP